VVIGAPPPLLFSLSDFKKLLKVAFSFSSKEIPIYPPLWLVFSYWVLPIFLL
jgi:hypothetical protein